MKHVSFYQPVDSHALQWERRLFSLLRSHWICRTTFFLKGNWLTLRSHLIDSDLCLWWKAGFTYYFIKRQTLPTLYYTLHVYFHSTFLLALWRYYSSFTICETVTLWYYASRMGCWSIEQGVLKQMFDFRARSQSTPQYPYQGGWSFPFLLVHFGLPHSFPLETLQQVLVERSFLDQWEWRLKEVEAVCSHPPGSGLFVHSWSHSAAQSGLSQRLVRKSQARHILMVSCTSLLGVIRICCSSSLKKLKSFCFYFSRTESWARKVKEQTPRQEKVFSSATTKEHLRCYSVLTWLLVPTGGEQMAT